MPRESFAKMLPIEICAVFLLCVLHAVVAFPFAAAAAKRF